MTIAGLMRLSGAILATALLLCTPGAQAPAAHAAGTSAGPADAERTVREFNEALSARRLEGAVALIEQGAVQFSIRAAHGFTAGGPGAPLTGDLAAQWRAVAGVLYAATRSYRREVLQAVTHAEGDLAVVWATVRTSSQPLEGNPAPAVRFAEAYLLRRADGRWKIIGMANDRPTR